MAKNKIKTKKSVLKRFKITGSGKVVRSHQLRANHYRRNKSKKALRRHQVMQSVAGGEVRDIKRMLGV